MKIKFIAPDQNPNIYQKYDIKNIKNKIANKLAFQEEFGYIVDRKIPLLCITIELSDEKNGHILLEIIEGILQLNIQLVILGIGTEKYQDFLSKMTETYRNKLKILPDNKILKSKIYAASDIGLIHSHDRADQDEVIKYLQYAVIPVINQELAKGIPIKEYNPIEEYGNAFIYNNHNKWLYFASIIKAQENYLFPYDWKNIQKNAMKMISK